MFRGKVCIKEGFDNLFQRIKNQIFVIEFKIG